MTRAFTLTSVALAAALAAVLPAAAQQMQGGERGGGMQGMQHNMQGGSMQGGSSMGGMQSMNMANMNAAQKEYQQAMEKMNKDMMQGMMDPDPGKSWMKQMIAHHQGAVDMSEVALKHSKDDDVRKEARKTKEQNEKDMKELQAELRKKER
ncbi:DUF305 domain-containing protein [Methylobacterium sp.]|uniref:DUF305 domain-containing protein n=1 Tax=Methylobacterium sp. TaxID=409 RepID=UPI0025F4F67B|nr:DUF305 domain-containing protein [Methylobacterium sp.]